MKVSDKLSEQIYNLKILIYKFSLFLLHHCYILFRTDIILFPYGSVVIICSQMFCYVLFFLSVVAVLFFDHKASQVCLIFV